MKLVKLVPALTMFFVMSCQVSPTVSVVETKTKEKPLMIEGSKYESIKQKFSLKDNLSETSVNLGNLSPKYAMAQVQTDCSQGGNIDTRLHFLDRLPCRYYILEKNNDYEIIKDIESFKKTFAPIDSKEKALSYAVALSNNEPRYDNFTPYDTVVYKGIIEKTNVKEEKDGYKINLYSDSCFRLNQINYLLTKDGDLKYLDTVTISQDKKFEGLICD